MFKPNLGISAIPLSGYDNDMFNRLDPHRSIVRVYKTDVPFFGTPVVNKNLTLIWERPAKEYTIEELTEIIGHEFKIKKK